MAVTRFSALDASTAKYGGGKIKPYNVVAPVISGPIGGVLTVDNGTWINSPTGYAYSWQCNGSNVPGANSNTFDSASFTGAPVTAHVIATNADGFTIATAQALGGGVPQTKEYLLTGDSQVANIFTALKTAFNDNRKINSEARGGYTSSQAAAITGGQPIELTVANDQLTGYGETLLHDFDFTGSNLNGFVATGSPAAVVTATAEGMLVTGIGVDAGVRLLTGVNLPIGTFKVLAYCKEAAPGGSASSLRIQSRTGANAVAGDIGQTGGNVPAKYGSGVTTAVGSRIAIVGSANETAGTGSLIIKRLVIYLLDATLANDVSAKTINILRNTGNYTGSQQGAFLGNPAFILTDGSGNWKLYRMTAGAAVSAPPGTKFIPDAAGLAKTVLAAYGAGRNGAGPGLGPGVTGSGYTIEGDLAAFVASLGHSGFLIFGETTGRDDSPGNVSTINARIAAGKTLYGSKYVDFMPALLAAAISDPGNPGYADDQADKAAGRTPRSLLDSGGLHFNDAGNAIKAAVFVAAHYANGYL